MVKTSDVAAVLRSTGFGEPPFGEEAAKAAPAAPLRQATGARPLEGLYNMRHRVRDGAAIGHLHMRRPPPQADSIESLCEMVEIWWCNVLMHVPFDSIAQGLDVRVNQAVTELNKCVQCGVYTGLLPLSPRTLFRSQYAHLEAGPFVSQFLVRDFSMGGTLVRNRIRPCALIPAHGSVATWLAVQEGGVAEVDDEDDGSPSGGSGGGADDVADHRYIHNGATLAAAVHKDVAYQIYYCAAYIAHEIGIELSALSQTDPVSTPWTDFGMPDVLCHLGRVACGALRHAWLCKWHDYVKLRPEALAMRFRQLDRRTSGRGVVGSAAAAAALRECTDPLLLKALRCFTNTYAAVWDAVPTADAAADADADAPGSPTPVPPMFLCYPEGSPTHPAYPAGHATVAGACVTVLKACFRCHDADLRRLAWPTTVLHSVDGVATTPVEADAHGAVTIVGEFNKLAANVQCGRMFAAVHYRSDEEGLVLGEQYALTYLRDVLRDYAPPPAPPSSSSSAPSTSSPKRRFVVELLDGRVVEVDTGGVRVLRARSLPPPAAAPSSE